MPVFFYRYLIFSAIPLLFLFLQGLFKLPQKVTLLGIIFIVSFYVAINFESFSRHPNSFREEKELIYQTKTPGDSPIYTVLPSFAEVTYYFSADEQIFVKPEGLVQFSGKSLLDSFVRKGKIKVQDPLPGETHWFLEPGPHTTKLTAQET
jgi:hypothetical protein